MAELKGVYSALLGCGLLFLISACSTEKTSDVSPSANGMIVTLHKTLYGSGGVLCDIPVPDRGTAPICKEALAAPEKPGGPLVPKIWSISFKLWRGTHSVCLQTDKSVDVLCVLGTLPDDNVDKTPVIADMRLVNGYPEFLKSVVVTYWNAGLFNEVTKLQTYKSGQ